MSILTLFKWAKSGSTITPKNSLVKKQGLKCDEKCTFCASVWWKKHCWRRSSRPIKIKYPRSFDGLHLIEMHATITHTHVCIAGGFPLWCDPYMITRTAMIRSTTWWEMQRKKSFFTLHKCHARLVSFLDLHACFTTHKEGPWFFSYSCNNLLDIGHTRRLRPGQGGENWKSKSYRNLHFDQQSVILPTKSLRNFTAFLQHPAIEQRLLVARDLKFKMKMQICKKSAKCFYYSCLVAAFNRFAIFHGNQLRFLKFQPQKSVFFVLPRPWN